MIIFLFIVFAWKRDEKHHGLGALEGIAPALAMGAMQKHHAPVEYGGNYRGHQEHWDTMTAQLKEFGEIKKEMALLSLGQSREMDQRFFEQQKTMLVGFKDTEIQGMNNTREVLARVDALERRQDMETIRKQGEEINYLKTVMSLQQKAPVPAYFPQYQMPVQHNIYEAVPGCR